jgi:hypothetical protein
MGVVTFIPETSGVLLLVLQAANTKRRTGRRKFFTCRTVMLMVLILNNENWGKSNFDRL